MSANVAQIIVKANTAQAQKGIKGLTDRMGGLKGAAIGVGIAAGAAAVGGIAAFAKSSISAFAAAGDEVQKMALRTGFTTEALSELKHAAELSGASLSSMENGVKRMQRTILDAENGLSTATDAFEMLGIEMADVEGKTPEEQFTLLSGALADVEDASRRSALAQQVFGRAGTQLLPMLAAGKDGLAAMRQEAHDLGMVFDQEAADSAAKYQDSLTKLSGAFDGIKFAVGSALVPVLIPLIEKLTQIATVSQKYVGPVMQVIGNIFKVLAFNVKVNIAIVKGLWNMFKGFAGFLGVDVDKALRVVKESFVMLGNAMQSFGENWRNIFNSAITTVESWINIVVSAFNQLVGMMPDFIKGKLGIEEMSEITLPRLEVVTGDTKMSIEELNIAAEELGNVMEVANTAIVADIAAIDDLAEITFTAAKVETVLADAREQSTATVHDLIKMQAKLDQKQKDGMLRQMHDANVQLAQAGVTGQMFNQAGELVNTETNRSEMLKAGGISFGGSRQYFEKDAQGKNISKMATAYNQRFTGQQLIEIGVIKVEAGIWTTDEAALGDAIGEAIIKASKRSGPVLTAGTVQA